MCCHVESYRGWVGVLDHGSLRLPIGRVGGFLDISIAARALRGVLYGWVSGRKGKGSHGIG